METKKRFYREHTIESLMEIAKKYTRKIDFFKADSGAYNSAKKRGIFEEICSHMEDYAYRPRISDEDLKKDISKYKKLTTLLKKDKKLYALGRLRFGLNFFDNLRTNRKLTNEELISFARKFDNKKKFREADTSIYQICLSRGILGEATKHMNKNPQKSIVKLERLKKLVIKERKIKEQIKKLGA